MFISPLLFFIFILPYRINFSCSDIHNYTLYYSITTTMIKLSSQSSHINSSFYSLLQQFITIQSYIHKNSHSLPHIHQHLLSSISREYSTFFNLSFFPCFLYSHSSFESIKNDYCTQSYMVSCSCHRQQQWRYPPWWLLHWRYFSLLLPHSFLTSLTQIKIGAHNYQMSLRDLPSHLQMKYRYVPPLSCCE